MGGKREEERIGRKEGEERGRGRVGDHREGGEKKKRKKRKRGRREKKKKENKGGGRKWGKEKSRERMRK